MWLAYLALREAKSSSPTSPTLCFPRGLHPVVNRVTFNSRALVFLRLPTPLTSTWRSADMFTLTSLCTILKELVLELGRAGDGYGSSHGDQQMFRLRAGFCVLSKSLLGFGLGVLNRNVQCCSRKHSNMGHRMIDSIMSCLRNRFFPSSKFPLSSRFLGATALGSIDGYEGLCLRLAFLKNTFRPNTL